MNNKELSRVIENSYRNLGNILAAVQNAGGSVSAFVHEDMTLKDFLTTCAKNNIEISAKHVHVD